MKTVRFFTIGLLFLTGVLHLLQIPSAAVMGAVIVITVIFGIIYLVLGFLLFRGSRTIIWFAAILPLVGLILAAIGMLSRPTLIGALFMAIDIAISACCFYLIFHSKERSIAK